MGRYGENQWESSIKTSQNRSVPSIPRAKAAAPAAAAKPATNGNHEVGEFCVVRVCLIMGKAVDSNSLGWNSSNVGTDPMPFLNFSEFIVDSSWGSWNWHLRNCSLLPATRFPKMKRFAGPGFCWAPPDFLECPERQSGGHAANCEMLGIRDLVRFQVFLC